MAGLGRKVFAAGDVLAAADVDGYLMDQSVMKFASDAARSSAIGTAVSAGMTSYRTDAKTIEVYDGSSWNTLGAPDVAGKNKIINGAFDHWQRLAAGSTSISLSNAAPVYTADRWYVYSGFSAGTSSFSQQTFTPGTAPVAGYEGTYFGRLTCGSTASYVQIDQKIEDVRTLAGQTATLSFWAKSSAGITLQSFVAQSFGSGGSSQVTTNGAAPVLTTSWVRYTTTIAIPSIAGKTIGSGNYLSVAFGSGALLNSATIDIWGVQLEAGSVATPFSRAGGTIQGELAACQRYYWRIEAFSTGSVIFNSAGQVSTTIADIGILTPQMRAITSLDVSNVGIYKYGGAVYSGGTWSLAGSPLGSVNVRYTHGSAVFTAGQVGNIITSSTYGYLGLSAEL